MNEEMREKFIEYMRTKYSPSNDFMRPVKTKGLKKLTKELRDFGFTLEMERRLTLELMIAQVWKRSGYKVDFSKHRHGYVNKNGK